MSNKRNNVELVAVDGRNAGAGTISNDDGAKDATAPPAKKHKKKTKVDSDDAGADNTSNDDGDKDATAAHTKEKLKKDKEKDRELSPTSEDAADSKCNPDAKRSKKENNFLNAFDAMDVDDKEAHDAQSVGSVGNTAAMVNQKSHAEYHSCT